MKKQLIDILKKEFNSFPSARAEAVPLKEINEKFAQIGFNLTNDYKEFVQLFGGGHVGSYPIFGLRKSKSMGSDKGSSLEVTARYRSEGWFSKEWFDRENVLVISSDHSGNPYIMDEKGKIWLLDHDLGSSELIAENFEDFLLNWCLKDIE